MYIFAYLLVYWIIYDKSIKSLVCWSHLDVCLFVPVCFFSTELLELNFNDTLVSSTHTLPVNIFNMEGGETMLAPNKLKEISMHRRESNSRPSGSVVGTSNIVFGGSWLQLSPGVRKFSLSRASMVSPPSKFKMFSGSVCVLLTSVSLKLIKIKLIYATTSWCEKNKLVGERVVSEYNDSFHFIDWFHLRE